MNYKILLAYDGTHYFGWQKTFDGPSIEGEVERALTQILQEPISLQATSRTDRGVHAASQVAQFFSQKEIFPDRLRRSLNSLLPEDIRIISIEEVEDSFHPTLDALGKEYHYLIYHAQEASPFLRHYAWHLHHPLNFEAMERAKLHLIGRQDFSAFCNQNEPPPKDPVREIFSIEILPLPENLIRFEVKGDHFLYKMVRNLVGTLIYVGMGKISAEEIPHLLLAGKRSGMGVTAPAHGLTLKQVFFSSLQLQKTINSSHDFKK